MKTYSIFWLNVDNHKGVIIDESGLSESDLIQRWIEIKGGTRVDDYFLIQEDALVV